MIKVFSGSWRGIGEKTDGLALMMDFRFREILHHFKGAKLAVFMCIVLHSDKEGRAWPGYDLIEKETGYSRESIAEALADLCTLTIEGQRILLRYRERDENNRFVGGNHYLIFPTVEEVTNLEGIQTPQADPQSGFPNGGKSRLEVLTNSLSKSAFSSENAPATAPQAPRTPRLTTRGPVDPMWAIGHGEAPEAASPEALREAGVRNAVGMFAAHLAPLALAFIEASGIVPTQADFSAWTKALAEQYIRQLTPTDIREAVKKLRADGLTVSTPFAATKTAVDIHARRKSTPATPAPTLVPDEWVKPDQLAELGIKPPSFKRREE